MQTGKDLKAARIAKGWSQRKLARQAGVHHKAVSYWEGAEALDPYGHAPARIAEALGGEFCDLHARARGGVLSEAEDLGAIAYILEGIPKKLAKRLIAPRVTCGAKTRSGAPCRAKSEPGRQRCRFHGGLSTGPKTKKGRERIAQAQRKRWAKSKALDSAEA